MRDAAAIIVIGNEILTGKVRDSNSAFLVSELRELGTPVARIHVIPDQVPVIAETVRAASATFRHVLTSGGVGPTLDDVTLEGIAGAFGDSLHLDQRLAAIIRAHFGDATRDAHLKMAMVPQSSELLFSPHLPWPVLQVRNVFIFPGDPGILQKKFHAIKERFRASPFILRKVFTRQEEGELAQSLLDVQNAFPAVAVGSYPVYNDPSYAVLLTLESKTKQEVESALALLLTLLSPDGIVRIA